MWEVSEWVGWAGVKREREREIAKAEWGDRKGGGEEGWNGGEDWKDGGGGGGV